jgi:cysteine desulfurase
MIYLDYNASTPMDPAVREAMLPYLGEHFGNPTSSHGVGVPLRSAIDSARGQVASLLGASAGEIFFSSGGTESNNHVVKGVAFALAEKGKHIVTSSVEHPAIKNPCKFLEKLGYEISYVGVDSNGRIDPSEVAGEIRPTTILISIMHANNEVGTIQDIPEISAIAREAGVLLHTDAAQSCGKIETRVDKLGVDFLTIAGHKFYGPQGIGALYIKKGVKLDPLHHGAGHQSGIRAGTEPVAMIVGLGKAAELAEKDSDHSRVADLRDRLYAGLCDGLGDDVVLLGHQTDRLPNTLCVGFRGRIGGEVMAQCPDVLASTGAACHSGKAKRSATLAAMDIPKAVAFGAVRLSIGRFTNEVEIDEAVGKLVTAAKGAPVHGAS